MLVMKKNHYFKNSPLINIVKKFLVCLALSWVIALSAQIIVSLPVVPITMQNTTIMLIALLSTTRIAVATTSLYFLQAVWGFPVMAGGKGGLVAVMGPTGGFLMGFIVMAFLIGYLNKRVKGSERGISSMISKFCILSVGQMGLYLCGLLWMSILMSSENALIYGLYPFLYKIPASIVVAILLEKVYKAGKKMFGNKAS
jgi:biotin transport system substrate-specific component